jgi:hypothetical protein
MDGSLSLQLVVASAMVALTILIHLGGLSLLVRMMRRPALSLTTHGARLNQAATLVGAAFGLFALHSAEIWAYASLYVWLNALPAFEDALYFSTATYTTVGYGDLTLGRDWRILGAIEGANGIILLGWSTAFFVSVVARIRVLEHDSKAGDSAV